MTDVPDPTLSRVRGHLRGKSIKLWLPPYTDQDGQQRFEAVGNLAVEISKDLGITVDAATSCLNELHNHTIERMKQNENFKKNKLATLKIKFTTKKSNDKSEFEIIQTKLDVNGAELKKAVAEKLRIVDDIKLICSGRVIQNETSLERQGVKHNGVILCLVLANSGHAESAEVEEAMRAVNRARKGAELLAAMGTESSQSSSKYDVQIADQQGRSLDLPEEEKRSLTVALGLHEKGRAMVKRKKYDLGLLLLLEADKEFSECRAEILTMVDNYAVLGLDIVWCYVCMKNISALPDAKVRLKGCEEAFKKSYGDSLQRLLAIKGHSGSEVTLFVRLYLLQGIVSYYEGRHKEAAELLEKAQGYARNVVIDEDKVTEMMKIGISGREARRALRSNMMDVSMATQWAFKRREEHAEIKKQEKEKKRKKVLQKKLGPCANGDPVNIGSYEQLVLQMGFEPVLVGEALKHANNDVGGAIEMIGSNPDLLREAAKADKKERKKSGTKQDASGESSSKGLTAEEEEMVRDVAHDVTTHDDEYMDITLEEEMQLIVQYLTMVASVTEK